MTNGAPLVVVTGAGRDGQLGAAVARAFAASGHALALIDRTDAHVHQLADTLRATYAGVSVSSHAADLADAHDAERAVKQLLTAHPAAQGKIHAAVLSAGGFAMTNAVDTSDPAVWARMFRINVDTAYATTRALLPALRAARGSLVYVGSVAALPQAKPRGVSAYAASKSALLSFMRCVAAEERAHGVRANAVAPGTIRTRDNIEAMGDNDSYVSRESIASVVQFLVSDSARDVTGQTIPLAPGA